MAKQLRVGVVGAGNISREYLETLTRLPGVRPTLIASRDFTHSQAAVARFPDIRAVPLSELYASDQVDLVLDLTTPAAHAEVSQAALAAGKHLYGEKPLATTTAEARSLLATAAKTGLRVGCAPDTVLGTGIQTARACLDTGGIGTPVAASAFMAIPGHEQWHPNPEFYYRAGGGPLLDMGPYYLTALVTLLGPVQRVVGMTGTSSGTRFIGSGPRLGTAFAVEVATHVTGVLHHEGGALSTLIMSFDVWKNSLPKIEVYGTAGSLSVPDPSSFTGNVLICCSGASVWSTVPVSGGYSEASRGFGVADMARAISTGAAHRASAELAYHVLDIMEGLHASAKSGDTRQIESRCERPAPVPAGALPEYA
ncbi:Gfo/Idh/MocA family oxidoreductase [Streptomyces tendae]|uniref:Gfo/Idh/MocA family protein n=1 Tax=Streptomyces tendae TaxID=1932 RepID=UPI0033EB0C7A